MSTKLISADSHIVEPGNLWVERLDREYREDAPRAEKSPKNGHWYFVGAGMPGGTDLTHATSPGLTNDQVDAKVAKLDPNAPSPTSPPPAERLADLWRDNTVADVLYSTCAFELYHLPNPEMKAACFRVYNDWIAEFCSADRARLIGAGLLALDDFDEAERELRRCIDLGLPSVMIPARPPEGRTFADEGYERLWTTAEEAGVVIAMHVATGQLNQTSLRENFANVLYFDLAAQEELKRSVAELVAGRVFERHPSLKVVAAEGGFDFAAALGAKMDKAYKRWHARWDRPASPLPSELFGENLFFTFIEDYVGLLTLPSGIERSVMWSSDYPHRNSTWPKSQERIEEDFSEATVPAAAVDLILFQNAARLYGIDVAAVAEPSPLIKELV
jgi:predicted TIM-barrel fold metal-dependent hydrolase